MTRRFTALLFALVLGLAVLPSQLSAKDYRIEFRGKAVVNGTELEAGEYKIRLVSDDTAEFYLGSDLVATSKVEVKPIGNATPNSVSVKRDGRVVEIRLKEQRVVIVES